MHNQKQSSVGFEIASEDDDKVVYKPVLPSKMSKKERKKRELKLPQLTISYFDKEDIERLKEIQLEIADEFVIKKNGEFMIWLNAIKNFLTK